MPNFTAPALVSQAPGAAPEEPMKVAVPCGAQAPERARAWLRDITGTLPNDTEGTLTLLVSELVTNAVRHGAAGDDELIELELQPLDGGVNVSVSDPGPGFSPSMRDAPLDEPGGWGLVLVDQLSERWGVVRDGRTRVWFELSTAG